MRPVMEPPVAVVAPAVTPIENVTPLVAVPLPMAMKNKRCCESTVKPRDGDISACDRAESYESNRQSKQVF